MYSFLKNIRCPINFGGDGISVLSRCFILIPAVFSNRLNFIVTIKKYCREINDMTLEEVLRARERVIQQRIERVSNEKWTMARKQLCVGLRTLPGANC